MKSFAPERIPTCANCVTLVGGEGKEGKEGRKRAREDCNIRPRELVGKERFVR